MILRPGRFLQDRYEILESIGSGGMSVVYKAKCHKLNRLVAIKVLNEEFSGDANFVAKFKMEAQAAAGLSHPNIVSVFDVVDEGQLHYIVMELVEGITLKNYIARKGRLAVRESLGIAIQVAQGMAAAHEQNIIHRDIKPQNMIISTDGKVKVADFGIARAVSAQTLTSAAMGSVHYISPEQARGGFSDVRSDIYSLGVTMYEMVTGRVPFDGDNTVAIALAHLEDAVIWPSVYNPEITQDFEQIILRCMEKKPERRYPNANALISDLREALMNPQVRPAKQISHTAASQTDTAGAGANPSATVLFTAEELSQIQNRSAEAGAGRSFRTSRGEYSQEPPEPDDFDPDEEDPDGEMDGLGFDRLFAGAGVIIAIIVVAVLLLVFSRLGGLFGSDLWSTAETETEEALVIDGESLSDTEFWMPDIVGMTEEEAEELLAEYSVTLKRSYEYSDDAAAGTILSSDPASGEVALKSGSVNVVISNGTDKIDLDALGISDMTADLAKKYLENRGITVTIEEVESETDEAGTILSYTPVLVEEGGSVTLTVSTGPHVEMATVPDLTGVTEEEAVALLIEAGLLPGTTSEEASDTVEQGLIIGQSAGAGAQLAQGSTVDYVVSSGPEAAAATQRYVASINEVYDLSNLIGPGAGTSTVTVQIRLKQGTDDDPVYRVLTQSTTVSGDVLLPVSYTSIESIDGSDQGVLEIVEVTSGAVIKTYTLTFFAMD